MPVKRNKFRKIISIHAPPRGATAAQHKILYDALFQFTPLREGRRRTGGSGK